MTDQNRSTAPDPDPAPTAPPRGAYEVPADAAAEECPDCGRPFPNETLLALHRGHEHGETVSPSNGEAVAAANSETVSAPDGEAVASAREAEARQLRLFRLKAIAVLVVLYFGLLMVYAVVI